MNYTNKEHELRESLLDLESNIRWFMICANQDKKDQFSLFIKILLTNIHLEMLKLYIARSDFEKECMKLYHVRISCDSSDFSLVSYVDTLVLLAKADLTHLKIIKNKRGCELFITYKESEVSFNISDLLSITAISLPYFSIFDHKLEISS
ncbi:MAG: hypothetical protein ACK41T_02350 [Pseudobdellovibrio sp.]